MQPVIHLQDVCFSYDIDEVLHHVNLQVFERDRIAIVGPNGGGKTTLLRLILGLLEPRFGTVRVYGQPPAVTRRRLGYVPQQVQFDPQFPVNATDVVLMGRAERHRVGLYDRADRVAARQALEQVDGAHLGQRPFAELSGGERQRVLIAQALATGTDVLLMDEPTANVDFLMEQRLYELFHQLEARLTIVIVSHNVNLVMAHVNRVVCVNRTAVIHPIEEVTASTLQEAYGDGRTGIRLDEHRHVMAAAAELRDAHRADAADHDGRTERRQD
jgi:zinc transport system ATP-binding protein